MSPIFDSSAPQDWYRFSIARLYAAYFGRVPDNAGWKYWNNQHVHFFADMPTISENFTYSEEFTQKYGKLSDTQFVDMVYLNVLGRSYDAAGRSYWSEQIRNGLSRGEVMMYFSDSTEYKTTAGPMVTGDCWDGNVISSHICAAPDVPGF